MPSSKLKELIREKVRQKLRERSQKNRKEVEGRVNIEGVTHPKHQKPKVKPSDNESKRPIPASVSIGAHGGRFVQEASGHKRYLKEGTLSGRKKMAKAIESIVREINLEDQQRKQDFFNRYKRRKSNER